MKVLAIRISAAAALLMGFLLWMYGGARAGFYQDMYRERRFDEILEIEYFEEFPAFLPGIETLLFGFMSFVGLMLLGNYIESKRPPTD